MDQLRHPVAGAAVTLSNSLTGYEGTALTGADGSFVIANVPFHSYLLRVRLDGFRMHEETVGLRNNLPHDVEISLAVASQSTRLEVLASDSATLIEPESNSTKAELNAKTIEQMPISPTRRGLESVLLSFSGFAANANGAIHPRGAHNQMTFVIGIQINAAQFDTLSRVSQVSGGGAKWGYFAALNTLKTNRYRSIICTTEATPSVDSCGSTTCQPRPNSFD